LIDDDIAGDHDLIEDFQHQNDMQVDVKRIMSPIQFEEDSEVG